MRARALGRLLRGAPILLPAAAALLIPGCSGGGGDGPPAPAAAAAIEGGAWSLRLEPLSGEEARERAVTVEVVPAGEAAEVTVSCEADEEGFPRTLGGTLEGKTIRLAGHDDDWTLLFRGAVESPRSMKGTVLGRARGDDEAFFEARWSLTRTAPGAAASPR